MLDLALDHGSNGGVADEQDIVVYLDIYVSTLACLVHLAVITTCGIDVLRGIVLGFALKELVEKGKILFIFRFGNEHDLVQQAAITDQVSLDTGVST